MLTFNIIMWDENYIIVDTQKVSILMGLYTYL